MDLFYNVFKGIGEIGTEFVRVPNVGQSKWASSKSNQHVHYPARPPAPVNKITDIIGQSSARGVSRLTKATLRSPMTFTVGMAQGAHNMPRMWGDKTVRPQEKITDLGSGLKAAGKVCIHALECVSFDTLILLFFWRSHSSFYFITSEPTKTKRLY